MNHQVVDNFGACVFFPPQHGQLVAAALLWFCRWIHPCLLRYLDLGVTMCAPPVMLVGLESRFPYINYMTIITLIIHGYWSYVHQLSYRLGGSALQAPPQHLDPNSWANCQCLPKTISRKISVERSARCPYVFTAWERKQPACWNARSLAHLENSPWKTGETPGSHRINPQKDAKKTGTV